MSAIFAAAGGPPLAAEDVEQAIRESTRRGADRVESRIAQGAALASVELENRLRPPP